MQVYTYLSSYLYINTRYLNKIINNKKLLIFHFIKANLEFLYDANLVNFMGYDLCYSFVEPDSVAVSFLLALI